MRLVLHPAELVMAGSCALMGALFLYECTMPLADFDPPTLTLLHSTVSPEITSVIPPSDASLSVIDARPVFNPARTPIQAVPVPGSGVSSAPPPIDFELVGIIIDGETQLALLKAEGAPFATSLGAGATIGGWQISEIALDHVVLRAGTAEETLRMDDKRKIGPSQPSMPGIAQSSNPVEAPSQIYSSPPGQHNLPTVSQPSSQNGNP